MGRVCPLQLQLLDTPADIVYKYDSIYIANKLCGRPPQYDPPCDLDLCLESGARVMCDVSRLRNDYTVSSWTLNSSIHKYMSDVGYLCANFSLPRPLGSRLRPDVRDRRQTDRC